MGNSQIARNNLPSVRPHRYVHWDSLVILALFYHKNRLEFRDLLTQLTYFLLFFYRNKPFVIILKISVYLYL